VAIKALSCVFSRVESKDFARNSPLGLRVGSLELDADFSACLIKTMILLVVDDIES